MVSSDRQIYNEIYIRIFWTDDKYTEARYLIFLIDFIFIDEIYIRKGLLIKLLL